MSQEELFHYGIKRKSGRYPWGSGGDPYQRSNMFYRFINDLKKRLGFSDKEIVEAVTAYMPEGEKFTIANLRDTRTIAKETIVHEQTMQAVRLRDKGVSVDEIGRHLDLPPATVRLRLKNSESEKLSSLTATADMLKRTVDEHQIVDIGSGTELSVAVGTRIGISAEKLRAATGVLRDEGYETYNIDVRNPGTRHMTRHKVLVPPGTGFAGARKMVDKIHTIGEWTEDNGKTWLNLHPPKTIDPKRVMVRFEEDGGKDEDGMIYVRPGVPDLDMGKNTYAQVRVQVGDGHYAKGIAVLKHDMPDGVDMIVNSNKPRSVGKLGALKELNDDPDNPFGSVIKRQIVERDKAGVERVKSVLNIVNEEGDWSTWRDSLPSQMLAKQPHSLIKSQLSKTRDEVRDRVAEIESITNPVVRKKALEDYASQIDSDAVDLRAASLPGQKTQLILSVPSLPKNQVYAPNFETGDSVVLIRYPHGGRFEIPEVTVNNNHRGAKKLLGNAPDAIGIHPAVAERLSGADFDGDTVVVIPNPKGTIKGSQSLGSTAKIYENALNNFDAKREYGGFVQSGVDKNGDPVGNFPLMKRTGLEMGKITNLITDMSIQGAKPEHVVRAVKHSMVVIDAEKHKLDYKASERNNGIAQLKELYQGDKRAGAKTLLSQATAQVKEAIPERKLRLQQDGGPIDPNTGALQYVPTGKTKSVYDPKTKTYTSEREPRTEKPKRLAVTDDAYTLVRDKSDPVERLYADHANEMKGLANKTRLTASRIPTYKQNPKAKEVYGPEIDDLVAQYKAARKQAPLERRAQVIAGAYIKARRNEDPSLRTDADRMQKIERQAKAAARARLGLDKATIKVSERQWDAIQSGGVSASLLSKMLKYTDSDQIKAYAMPKPNPVMTGALAARARAMLAAGATTADVARALGVAPSTLRAASSRGEV